MPLPAPVRPWHGEQNTLKRSWPRAITSAVTGIGNVVGELAVHAPSVEVVVLAQLAARHGVGDERPRGLAVGEERARLERLVARRVVHVLAARRRQHGERDDERSPERGARAPARWSSRATGANGATSDTPTGCRLSEKLLASRA